MLCKIKIQSHLYLHFMVAEDVLIYYIYIIKFHFELVSVQMICNLKYYLFWIGLNFENTSLTISLNFKHEIKKDEVET